MGVVRWSIRLRGTSEVGLAQKETDQLKYLVDQLQKMGHKVDAASLEFRGEQAVVRAKVDDDDDCDDESKGP